MGTKHHAESQKKLIDQFKGNLSTGGWKGRQEYGRMNGKMEEWTDPNSQDPPEYGWGSNQKIIS